MGEILAVGITHYRLLAATKRARDDCVRRSSLRQYPFGTHRIRPSLRTAIFSGRPGFSSIRLRIHDIV